MISPPEGVAVFTPSKCQVMSREIAKGGAIVLEKCGVLMLGIRSCPLEFNVIDRQDKDRDVRFIMEMRCTGARKEVTRYNKSREVSPLH